MTEFLYKGLSTKDVLSYLTYRDGVFYWENPLSVRVKKGDVAQVLGNRYMHVSINRKRYMIHKLVFFIHHEYVPNIVDHIDGNPLNNEIDNLREADKYKNNWNAKIRKHNRTGLKGVTYHPQTGKYRARIRCMDKVYSLGLFAKKEDAHQAYCIGSIILHKDFGRFQCS
jgi:HNH endonuclease/AP2 domain